MCFCEKIAKFHLRTTYVELHCKCCVKTILLDMWKSSICSMMVGESMLSTSQTVLELHNRKTPILAHKDRDGPDQDVLKQWRQKNIHLGSEDNRMLLKCDRLWDQPVSLRSPPMTNKRCPSWSVGVKQKLKLRSAIIKGMYANIDLGLYCPSSWRSYWICYEWKKWRVMGFQKCVLTSPLQYFNWMLVNDAFLSILHYLT